MLDSSRILHSSCLVLQSSTPPFTGWQNDLHLISGFDHRLLPCAYSDLTTLIDAATRAFPGAVSIGSCEDRSGYVCHRVPH